MRWPKVNEQAQLSGEVINEPAVDDAGACDYRDETIEITRTGDDHDHARSYNDVSVQPVLSFTSNSVSEGSPHYRDMPPCREVHFMREEETHPYPANGADIGNGYYDAMSLECPSTSRLRNQNNMSGLASTLSYLQSEEREENDVMSNCAVQLTDEVWIKTSDNFKGNDTDEKRKAIYELIEAILGRTPTCCRHEIKKRRKSDKSPRFSYDCKRNAQKQERCKVWSPTKTFIRGVNGNVLQGQEWLQFKCRILWWTRAQSGRVEMIY